MWVWVKCWVYCWFWFRLRKRCNLEFSTLEGDKIVSLQCFSIWKNLIDSCIFALDSCVLDINSITADKTFNSAIKYWVRFALLLNFIVSNSGNLLRFNVHMALIYNKYYINIWVIVYKTSSLNSLRVKTCICSSYDLWWFTSI